MTKSTHTPEKVQAAVDELIEKATSYDIDSLDRIYHDDLHIVMVDHLDNVNTSDKKQFKELFAQKKAEGNPKMNKWVKYHHIFIKGDNAVVALSRIK